MKLNLTVGIGSSREKSGGEHAAVHTLRELRGFWVNATAFGAQWLQHRFPPALLHAE